MRFCLSSKQPSFMLKNADEIRVEYADKQDIYDLAQNFQTKKIILHIPQGTKGIEWNLLKGLAETHQGGLAVALEDLSYIDEVNENGIEWFYAYPVDSFFFAKTLAKAGAKEVIPGMPLFFNTQLIRDRFHLKFRLFPNLAYFPQAKRESGIHGQWVRPEDLHYYEDYVSCVEFFPYGNIKKEAELYNIYAINQSWPGDLSLIIDYLNFSCDNRGITDEIALRRMNCAQTCELNENCHLCDRALSLNRTLADRFDNK